MASLEKERILKKIFELKKSWYASMDQHVKRVKEDPTCDPHEPFDYWIADFIIEDRKRVVRPAKEYRDCILKYSGLIGWVALDNKQKEAIEGVLKLGGLEND